MPVSYTHLDVYKRQVHYEKTYKEVLPEVPKKKQKAAPKKENAPGNRTKGKNNPKKNRGR